MRRSALGCACAATQDVDKIFRQEFKRRFKGWEETVKAASEVILDEMRTLLEHQP